VYGIFAVDVMQSIAVAAHGYAVLCADWGRPNALSLTGWFVTAVPVLSSTRQGFVPIHPFSTALLALQLLFGASRSTRGACTNSAAGRLPRLSLFLSVFQVRHQKLLCVPDILLQISLAQTSCAYSIGIEVCCAFAMCCKLEVT
jgi:hypothetical protein